MRRFSHGIHRIHRTFCLGIFSHRLHGLTQIRWVRRFSHGIHRIHRTTCWGSLPQIARIYTDAANFRGVHLSPLGFAACQSKKCTNRAKTDCLLGRFNNGLNGLNGFLLLGMFNNGFIGLNGFDGCVKLTTD